MQRCWGEALQEELGVSCHLPAAGARLVAGLEVLGPARRLFLQLVCLHPAKVKYSALSSRH